MNQVVNTGENKRSAGATLSSAEPLTNRQRFVKACHCQPVDRPPIWLMRQAGRCLPEYRALKEKYTFVELVQTPELAAEVTLQPIRRFDFDAAILFSDILVIAEGLGQKYRFRETGGIEMEFQIKTAEDIDKLQVEAIEERLHYTVDALSLIKKGLNNRTALIGFSGSPWTLANFMLEGGSSKEFTAAKRLLYSNPELFERLMEKITAAVTKYLQMQINAGVDTLQIFDTSGGILSESVFDRASAKWMRKIISGLKNQVPVTVFSKGMHGNWDALIRTGANVFSVDWTVNLAEIWGFLPNNVGIQGNLDPFVLTTNPTIVAAEATRILTEMRGSQGFIFNLGHGVPPEATLENLGTLATTVQNFK